MRSYVIWKYPFPGMCHMHASSTSRRSNGSRLKISKRRVDIFWSFRLTRLILCHLAQWTLYQNRCSSQLLFCQIRMTRFVKSLLFNSNCVACVLLQKTGNSYLLSLFMSSSWVIFIYMKLEPGETWVSQLLWEYSGASDASNRYGDMYIQSIYIPQRKILKKRFCCSNCYEA